MGPNAVDEARFEVEIATHLVDAGGYEALKVGTSVEDRRDFDPAAGIDTAELFAFVESTQPTSGRGWRS